MEKQKGHFKVQVVDSKYCSFKVSKKQQQHAREMEYKTKKAYTTLSFITYLLLSYIWLP